MRNSEESAKLWLAMNEKTEQIFEQLNNKQIEAVKAIEGPVLILAGAGSGKTRALTHRIAYMISQGIRPENILAVTFTNKAAGEMKHRVEELLKSMDHKMISSPWMGTFHSICVRMLRREVDNLGYNKNFLIYDYSDQLSLIKSVMNDLNIDIKKFNPKAQLAKISKLKSELVLPEDATASAGDYNEKILSSIYIGYQKSLEKNNALDFDDLIMATVKLLDRSPKILDRYQDLFKYILVDEYQDTNHAQYAFVNLLAKKHRNLFVIGDDYQSIYAWRQADIRNILDFEKDYPEVKTIMLEQNYRSTQNILLAANQVISNNTEQKHKKLWTHNDQGEQILLKELQDQREEARYIVNFIKSEAKQTNLNDFAILYRTHAQSRALEEEIVRHGLPYRIIGGVKFYERREVKDILAYLRLAYNPSDSVSFERIHNIPERGIGKITFEKIKIAIDQSRGIAKGINKCIDDGGFTGKRRAALIGLSDFIEELSGRAQVLPLSELITWVIRKSGYKSYIDDGTEEGEERWKNVKEIFTAAKKYDGSDSPQGLASFLEEVALIQETDKFEGSKPAINLMTFHSVKGLEFPVVFMAGMEDGIFPHSKAIFALHELEEERRLCYVGITRAKEKLCITFCRQRMLHGTPQFNPPSRFLFEIPENLVNFNPLGETEYYISDYD